MQTLPTLLEVIWWQTFQCKMTWYIQIYILHDSSALRRWRLWNTEKVAQQRNFCSWKGSIHLSWLHQKSRSEIIGREKYETLKMKFRTLLPLASFFFSALSWRWYIELRYFLTRERRKRWKCHRVATWRLAFVKNDVIMRSRWTICQLEPWPIVHNPPPPWLRRIH